ncbi:hypothetical protein IID10_11240, partial [candidate division KSB1 bacterium]|nr:hypothetical protein [candidate division KSB1 bacterium]
EVEFLLGDPTKAKRELGWQANTDLKKLVMLMVDADMEIVGEKIYGSKKRRQEISADQFVYAESIR